MAKRSGNGNGHKGNGADPVVTAIHELTSRVVERLEALETGQRGIEQVLRGHGEQLKALHQGLSDLRGDVHEGFAELGSKIVSAVERDRRLEERVAKLEAPTPEPR